MSNQPVLFLTHGPGPSFFLDASVIKGFKGVDKDSDAADFLRNLFKTVDIKRPKAILVLSAHWEETVCTVQVNNKPELYYDYSGFPPETYKLKWDVPGTADIAKQVKTLLESKGLKCKETTTRGLDHGVFVPLKLAVPNADIPVFQVSLLNSLNIEDNLKIGEALSELSKEGILIIGSGSATHAGLFDDTTADWAHQFKNWIHDVVTNQDYTPEERKAKFLSCKSEPFLSKAHPRIEHFLPIPMSCAASGYKPGKILHSEFIGSLLNEHYLF